MDKSLVRIKVADGTLIFHAESLALQKALDTVLEAGSSAFAIFSDSKSPLSDLKKGQGKFIPIIDHLQEKIHKIIAAF